MLKISPIQYSVTSAEKNINFKVEHQCPQCGAPVLLEEETLFFTCEFCRVRSYILQHRYPRYRLSPSKDIKDDQDFIYLPYWRFKGVHYTCRLSGVEYKFLDISTLALKHRPLNISTTLGFRSQALTLKMVSAKTKGTFLRPLTVRQAMLMADKRLQSSTESSTTLKGDPVFQENIGETTSLIFSPFHIKEGILYDSIINKPAGPADETLMNIQISDTCRPEKEISFLPGLCPSCGWDLEGNPDSIILVCRNCQTLWRSHENRLVKIKFGCATPGDASDVLLPFWKIVADVSPVSLKTYSDLIRLANLPKIPKATTDELPMAFWAPAFKIRPSIFLRLMTQLAIVQPGDTFEKKISSHRLSTVNLPSSEAVESIKIGLGALLKPATQYVPQLSEIKVKLKAVMLVYLPFEQKSHELYHAPSGISININALKLSNNL